MNFAHPIFFLGLLLIPLYVYSAYKLKPKAHIQISVFSELKKANKKSFVRYLNMLKHILIVLIIIFFCLTLARSQDKHEKEKVSKKGIDIVIALDVSGSMMAEDLKPNRIEAAKASLNKFVDNIKDDRLGIVVFAGSAFTQSPLTFDYKILEEYIEQISTESINQNVRGLNGTAIGDAILASISRFKKSEERSKVLIILTDGDANTGVNPEIAAVRAKEKGIKIYTVGIGKVGGAPMVVIDNFGRKVYARNRDGSVAIATFDEKNLKKIAQIGEGQYFRAGNNDSFKAVLEEISLLEKREIEINKTTEYTENFMKYLIILSVLMFVYSLIIGIKVIRI